MYLLMQLPGVAETCQDLSLRPLNENYCSVHVERPGKAFWWATNNNCWESLWVLFGEHCGKGVR